MESRQCKISALFGAALRLHPGCFQPQNKTDLPLWVCGQTGLVFPLVPSREHSLLSIRGAAGGFGFCVLPGVAPPFWGERQRRWGDDNTPPRGVPRGGHPSGRFFGDFLIGEKVTRVPSMARPCSSGAPAYRGLQGLSAPAKNLRYWAK